MEFGILKDFFGLIAIAISLGTGAYAFMTSKSRVNEEHLKRVDERLSDHDNQITSIKNDLKHLPGTDDVTELKLGLVELKGTVGRLEENMGSTSRTVHRMEEFLMSNGSK